MAKCPYLKTCSLAKTCTAIDFIPDFKCKGYHGFEWHYKRGYCTSKNGFNHESCIFYDYLLNNEGVKKPKLWSVS